VEHLRPGSNIDNAHDWATRRHTPGSPLRDTRGSLGRARAIRAAARAHQDLAAAAAAGLRQVDRDQPPLPAFEATQSRGGVGTADEQLHQRLTPLPELQELTEEEAIDHLPTDKSIGR
jgi:hypothetical protein